MKAKGTEPRKVKGLKASEEFHFGTGDAHTARMVSNKDGAWLVLDGKVSVPLDAVRELVMASFNAWSRDHGHP